MFKRSHKETSNRNAEVKQYQEPIAQHQQSKKLSEHMSFLYQYTDVSQGLFHNDLRRKSQSNPQKSMNQEETTDTFFKI